MTAATALARAQWTGAPMEGPVRVQVTTVHRRPKSRSKSIPAPVWAEGRRVASVRTPDADNAGGAVLDALKKAGVMGDDCQVADLRVKQWWGAPGENEHIEVTVTGASWTTDEEDA
jgi:Holliday junction resolvase RusA-like endonuclease